MDSSLAGSMKPQVFTKAICAFSGGTIAYPRARSSASSTSLSTRFLAQPSDTIPTVFMRYSPNI